MVLHSWAATRGHLREITRTDATTAIDPLRGWPRHNAITALRSLFRVLHEVLTVGPDPLHLALVFNLSHSAASQRTPIVVPAELPSLR